MKEMSQQLPNNFLTPCYVMTCCHYVIFWTYFDILIEFTSNMKCPGVLKARNYEELNSTNHGAIPWCRNTIFLAERHVFEKT